MSGRSLPLHHHVRPRHGFRKALRLVFVGEARRPGDCAFSCSRSVFRGMVYWGAHQSRQVRRRRRAAAFAAMAGGACATDPAPQPSSDPPTGLCGRVKACPYVSLPAGRCRRFLHVRRVSAHSLRPPAAIGGTARISDRGPRPSEFRSARARCCKGHVGVDASKRLCCRWWMGGGQLFGRRGRRGSGYGVQGHRSPRNHAGERSWRVWMGPETGWRPQSGAMFLEKRSEGALVRGQWWKTRWRGRLPGLVGDGCCGNG